MLESVALSRFSRVIQSVELTIALENTVRDVCESIFRSSAGKLCGRALIAVRSDSIEKLESMCAIQLDDGIARLKIDPKSIALT